MAEFTGIEWARGPHEKGATWNPWYGCQKVSPACAHCYAEREMTRFGKNFDIVTRASKSTFENPLKWKEPHGIFTCSWSDFFIAEADPWREEAFDVMRRTPQHTYLILTKRPQRAHQYAVMPENVWLGASVETPKQYERISELLATPARIHFLSIEPLLGRMNDIDLTGIDWVIVGGESGPGFRPLHLDWVKEIRNNCQRENIAFFFKQGSQLKPGGNRLLDGRTWEEFPYEDH